MSESYNRELFRVKAVWYLDIFPDELIIQEKTVSMIRRKFLVSYIETVPIRDIGRVVLTDVLLFASVSLIGKYTNEQLSISCLPKDKAKQAKEIIDGLLLAYENIIDIPDWLRIQTKTDMLEQAGKHEQFKEDIAKREAKY